MGRIVSFWGRRSDIGADEEGESCLLEVVVKMRRCCDGGRRCMRRDWSSATEMEEDTGRERVGGKPRPENEVSRTLTVDDAMANRGLCGNTIDEKPIVLMIEVLVRVMRIRRR